MKDDDLNKLRGKAVYCACSHNPSCVHCKGYGMVLIPHETVANTSQYFISPTVKIGVSPLERFMEMDESILPKEIKIWIKYKLSDKEFQLLTGIQQNTHFISIGTEFRTVDYALGTALNIINNRINFYYKWFDIQNKKFNIKIEIINDPDAYYLGSFNRQEEKIDQKFLKAFIQFFQKKFMPDIFQA